MPSDAIRLEMLPDPSFPNTDGFSRGNGNIVLTEFRVSRGDQPIKIVSAEADYEQRSMARRRRIG